MPVLIRLFRFRFRPRRSNRTLAPPLCPGLLLVPSHSCRPTLSRLPTHYISPVPEHNLPPPLTPSLRPSLPTPPTYLLLLGGARVRFLCPWHDILGDGWGSHFCWCCVGVCLAGFVGLVWLAVVMVLCL